MHIPRWLIGTWLLVPVVHGHAQTPAEDQRTLILQLDFGSDSAPRRTVELRKGILYWAEVAGPGTVSIRSADDRKDAFIVPVESPNEWRRFQVFALQTGPFIVTLTDRAAGSAATLRLFSDTTTTQRLRAQRDRGFAIGLGIAGGVHTGLAIDSIGGTAPQGSTDFEACVLLRSGSFASTCLGYGKQRFPDAGLNVGWLFLEERLRMVGGRLIGPRLTDVEAMLRYGKATGVGSRNNYPAVIGLGLQLVQHLNRDERRHGVSVIGSWQHQRLTGTARSRDRASNRFVVGFLWLP